MIILIIFLWANLLFDHHRHHHQEGVRGFFFLIIFSFFFIFIFLYFRFFEKSKNPEWKKIGKSSYNTLPWTNPAVCYVNLDHLNSSYFISLPFGFSL